MAVDKRIYHILYNPSNGELEGDTIITAISGAERGFIVELDSLYAEELSLVSQGDNTVRIEEGTLFPNIISLLSNTPRVYRVEQSNRAPYGGFREVIDVFHIHLTIPQTLVTTTQEVRLSVKKEINEIASSTIVISGVSTMDYQVEVPTWLTYEKTNGALKITTIAAEHLSVGELSGEVVISLGQESIRVPVYLTVTQNVLHTTLEEYCFCLDNVYIDSQQSSDEAKGIQVVLKFHHPVSQQAIVAKYQMPYFMGKARIDVGKIVQQYMDKRYENILDIPLKKVISSPLYVAVEFSEINAMQIAINSRHLMDVHFYPGKKPKGYPLLTNCLNRRRVQGSKVMVSYIEGMVQPEQWGLLPAISSSTHMGVSVIKLSDNTMNFPRVKSIETVNIITFPSTKKMAHVQWFNQNQAVEWATFTGEYVIGASFSNTINKGVISSEKKKYSSEKEKILKINTGFMLKKEIPMIEELLQSPLAFIEFPERVLRCIPVQDKVETEDSTKALINFELEFLIIEEIWI